MRAIESKQEFLQEYTSLLNDIEENIMNLAQFTSENEKDPDVVEEINRLKLHRKKLQDTLEDFQDASEVEWHKIRPKIRETFQKAEQEWNTIKMSLKSK